MNTEIVNCSECDKPAMDKDRIEWVRNEKLSHVQHRACFEQAERKKFELTKHLTTNLIMTASLNVARARESTVSLTDYLIDDACKRLNIDVKRFEVEAWFGGVASATGHDVFQRRDALIYPRQADSLQSIIEDSPHRTLAAKVDGIDVTGQEMAGRSLVELESDKARITLIAASREQTPRMGIQGIQGTEDECRRMLNLVREKWRSLKFEKV